MAKGSLAAAVLCRYCLTTFLPDCCLPRTLEAIRRPLSLPSAGNGEAALWSPPIQSALEAALQPLAAKVVEQIKEHAQACFTETQEMLGDLNSLQEELAIPYEVC